MKCAGWTGGGSTRRTIRTHTTLRRCGRGSRNFTPTSSCATAGESSSSSLAGRKTRDFSTCACSSRRRQRLSTRSRRLPQRNRAYQTARSAQSDTMRTQSASGNSTKWTPTMSRRGRRVARRTSRTVRCCAGRTTAPRGTGEKVHRGLMGVHPSQHVLIDGCIQK